ncbi:MAG TPA: M50 family metallopeptidase [Streptosporangiaceae bacterium]|nr:M50 family metallopeptidase [Streptosporangiaceae bacterium]
MPVFGWVHQLWDRVAGTQPVPPVWVIAMSGAIAVLIVATAGTWRLARNSITIAHEGGHALASVLSGRRLQGIRLHSDTSGVTFSKGKRTGPGLVLTLAAGYLAPSLLGAGAAWLLAAHHVTAMLWLMLALLAATFLAIRNAYGVLAVLLTTGAVLAVSWLATAAVQAAFGYTAAWFLLLGGVRAVAELQSDRRRSRRHGQVSMSDADQLGRLTGMPGGAWVAVFALACAAALILGARLLIPGVLHLPH